MNRGIRYLLLALASSIFLCACASARITASPQGLSSERDLRMDWWREARFGMFIHWGLYAIPAGEWDGRPSGPLGEWIMKDLRIPASEYEKLAQRFDPVRFDAREWVRLAREAGARYIIITSKHHDGFALYDSRTSGYDVMNTPWRRDVLDELARACRESDIRLGFYYSILDWHHPSAQGRAFPDYEKVQNPEWADYREHYMKAQLRELVRRYDPAVLWFDGDWVAEWDDAQGVALEQWLRSISPNIIVNNRIGKGRLTGKSGMSGAGDHPGDFGTPEQVVPDTGFTGTDWEACMTMNKSWGYKRTDHEWKSPATLIRTLIEVTSKGGNFLLNIGPDAAGEVPGPSVGLLASIGQWMRVNEASIYGTTASPVAAPPWGRLTAKPGKVFLHVFDWPENGVLELDLPVEVQRVYLLSDKSKRELRYQGSGVIRISVPEQAPDPVASVVVVEHSVRSD